MSSFKVVFVFVIFLAISCKKATISEANYYFAFSATLKGSNETPPNNSTASGTASATYNINTKILKINVTYSGLTATAAHIHKGAVGVSGPVIFPFTGFASPINYTSVALDSTKEADLMANLFYVNIHSIAFPNGEIRGQLLKQ
ncbi:MAG: CHRD domain-containing protein [Bacteroidota bacterium]|nr:CHRD domain-containing protein [Bacteroidota bacterium]